MHRIRRAALEAIYRQYLDVGSQYGLPMLLSTPTWRASQERIASTGYAGTDVNGDNFRFLDELRSEYGSYAHKVVVCGLLSCRGNESVSINSFVVDHHHLNKVL